VQAPFVSRVLAELLVPEPGDYTFRLTSDDGSRLFLGGRLLIDHDGRHGTTAQESTPVRLEAGAHPLLVEHFDAGGSRSLRLEWWRPGSDLFAVVTAEHAKQQRESALAAARAPWPFTACEVRL
jgi:hypothetical protein